MWYELYSWMEAITGKNFDYTEELSKMDDDFVFVNPFLWSIKFDDVIDGLAEAVDVIVKHADELPATLPTAIELKASIVALITESLVSILDKIKLKLNIHVDSLSSFDDLLNHKTALCGLITLLNDNEIETIHQQNMLMDLNDECNNVITDIFNISIEDLYILQTNIQTIKQEYSDNIDDEN